MKLKSKKTISRIKIDDYLLEPMKNKTSFITVTEREKKDIEDKKLIELVDKEAHIKMLSEEKLSGVIKEVNRDSEGELTITITNGEWGNRIKVKLNEIYEMEVSVYPYYSMEHKMALRQSRKPRREFRYTIEEAEELKDKFVSINYDGKKLEGRLIKINYKTQEDIELTIAIDNGEVKTVETYRLRELSVIGNSATEYKRFKRVRKFENDVLDELNYQKNFKSELEDSRVNAGLLLEKYFEAIIDYHNGEEINLANYDYDWISEMENIKEESESWDEVDQERHERNLMKAKRVNDFYNERKQFIREIVKKAEKIDWTKYGVSQKQGEMSTLRYVYESDIIYN